MQLDISQKNDRCPTSPMLQLALDAVSLGEARNVLRELIDYIDIIEIGTPFILRYGIKPVKEIRKLYPGLILLADFKIADAGEYESSMAFNAGADIVTVLAAAPDSTIKTVIRVAAEFKREVMVDIVGVNDVEKRVSEIDRMGVNYICAHTGLDEQIAGESTLKNLIKVKKNTRNAKIAVAGGINLSNLGAILKNNPAIVIVGGGITASEDRKVAAVKIKKIIDMERS